MLGSSGRRSVGDERLQVLVENVGLLVGEILKALERLVVGVLSVELDTELLQPLTKGAPPESLPSTILFAVQPTSSARMIS